MGCSFGCLKGNEQKFIGISKDLMIEGVTPSVDWDVQLQEWQLATNNLAKEFVEGKAILENYNTAEFNYQADLLPFNRWNERQDIQRLVAEKVNK